MRRREYRCRTVDITFIDDNDVPLNSGQSPAQTPSVDRLPIRYHARLRSGYHDLHLVPLNVLAGHVPELVLTDLSPIFLTTLIEHCIHV